MNRIFVVAFPLNLGLQLGYTKYCCFCVTGILEKKHYKRPKRELFIPGLKNVKHTVLSNPKNMYLSQLKIKTIINESH